MLEQSKRPLLRRLVAIVYAAIIGLARVLARVYWRIEIHGRDRLPPYGAYIVAPVHRSYVDFFIAGLAVPRQLNWVAKREVFPGGVADRLLTEFGAIPANRNGFDRTAIAECDRRIDDGHPVVMFAEGRRQDGPVVQPLLDGPAFLACRHLVPVVPVGIGGSDRVMPRGAKFVFPRKVVVEIGEPIYPDVDGSARVPRRVVREMTELLHRAIQGLYDSAHQQATGVDNAGLRNAAGGEVSALR